MKKRDVNSVLEEKNILFLKNFFFIMILDGARWSFFAAFGMFNSMLENMIAIQKKLMLERTYYG